MKKRKLPKGWVQTTLGKITYLSHERAQPAAMPNMRYVGLEHIESQTMRLLGHADALHIRSSSLRFYAGDLLYGRMRPYLNKLWVAEFDGLCSAEFLVFRKIDGVSNEFLSFRLNSDDFVSYANGRVSGERPRVDFEKLSPFPVLLPPAAEQERIAQKLSATLARMYRGEIAATRAEVRLKSYRAAVLDAAIAGELTQAWREQHQTSKRISTGHSLLKTLSAARRTRWETAETKRRLFTGKGTLDESWKRSYDEPTAPDIAELPLIPSTWVWTRLVQLGFVSGGLTKNPSRKNYHLKLPYLRVANVYANELRLDDIVRIGVKRDELDKLLLEKGDLLIVEGNGSKDQIGRLAIWDGSIERCVHQNHIIKVRLVDKSIGNWVLTWFLSPTGREHIEKVASSTTGLYTLSISKVSNLPVPLPSAPEQKEAGRQIGRRLSAADRLSAKLIQQSSAAKQMKKAVLQEAFAGDLIPQDANDEPAVVLLNRIQSNIDAEIQKSKVTRMKRKTKSTAKRRPLLDVLREQKKPMTPKQLFIISGYQKEFEDNEYDQQVVEGFYEELRHLVGPDGPIEELRPNRSRVLLGTKQ